MQLSSLKAHSNEISDAKQKIKRAQKYSANKSEMLSKKNEKYDPVQRHEHYVKTRAQASLNYYKRKNIVEKHRKDLQRSTANIFYG